MKMLAIAALAALFATPALAQEMPMYRPLAARRVHPDVPHGSLRLLLILCPSHGTACKDVDPGYDMTGISLMACEMRGQTAETQYFADHPFLRPGWQPGGWRCVVGGREGGAA